MNVFLNSTNHNFVIYFSNIYSTEIIKNLANPRLEAMIVVGAVKTFVGTRLRGQKLLDRMCQLSSVETLYRVCQKKSLLK